MPDPGEQAWIEWRRKQVTQLVRRIYIEAKAINPRIKVSAALIPWGAPPTSEKDFENVAPMQRIFQDWHRWLKEGILDLAVPMNYAREHDATVRGWFNGWIQWEKKHKHGRHLAVGVGAYVNSQQNTLAQIERVRAREGRNSADGVSFFSYANLFPATPPPGTAPPAGASVSAADAAVRAGAAFPTGTPTPGAAPSAPRERVAFLADGAADRKGAFAEPAPVPRMPWIDSPRTGWIAGTVKSDAPLESVRVVVKKGFFSRARRMEVDGNGWFGFTNLKPGRYKVWVETGKTRAQQVTLQVDAGRVARPTGGSFE